MGVMPRRVRCLALAGAGRWALVIERLGNLRLSNVIIGRALPDVRDGLKPAHRRVLDAMRQMGANGVPFECSRGSGWPLH